MIKRLIWYAGLSLAAILLIILSVGVVLYYLATRVPAFYRQAAADPTAQAMLNDRLLQKASSLTGDWQREGRWTLRLTEDEINAWLAVDLPKNHPNALPPELQAPRIRIGRDAVTLACRAKRQDLSGVLWVKVSVELQQPDEVILRIHGAGMGLLPISTKTVFEHIMEHLKKAGADVSSGEPGETPSLELALSATDPNRRRRIHLDALDCTDGHLFLSGTTEP